MTGAEDHGKIKAAQNSLKSIKERLAFVVAARAKEIETDRDIFDAFGDDVPIIVNLLKRAEAELILVKTLSNGFQTRLEKMEEISSAWGDGQEKLALAIMLMDPEIVALNPPIMRTLLFGMDENTMAKTFGPDGLLPLEQRKMMWRCLRDLEKDRPIREDMK